MKRKIILILLFLMLIPLGITLAQSSPSVINQQFALFSGGRSSSTNYSVDAVIGQPAAGVSSSANFQVSSGVPPSGSVGETIWLPMITR